ncbi:MAG: dipeptide epimerase [Bacteroidetes bacterium]|nr:dipeptide epimerase [Bacteroidota bacterium]HET6244403.1 dipeptide epimerase [Bacteroidia bacterium]
MLKYPFTLSMGSRTSTPIILTEIEHNGLIGFGEASLPPYLGETQKSVIDFLKKINFSNLIDPLNIADFIIYIDKLDPGNTAAKASIDIALHDLKGKLLKKNCSEFLNLPNNEYPVSSYTIGIDSLEKTKNKIAEAKDFNFFKIKLGSNYDKEIIETVIKNTDKPFAVDVNQGWKNKYSALDFVKMLEDYNCTYIEQPLPKEMIKETRWLADRSSVPIIADEAVQRINDINNADGIYHGINIKLMKCTGLNEALKMIELGREKQMKIIIGSMTETSCGIAAASHISTLADWADLDSSYLITNDLFEGIKIANGCIIPKKNKPGIGIEKL